MQVNSNGLLSFLTEIPNFYNIQFPLNYPVIAALYANVDTSARGQIFYRQSQDPELLRRFNERVTRFYPRLRQPFSATNLFIASWLEVGYFPQGADKVFAPVLFPTISLNQKLLVGSSAADRNNPQGGP